MDSRAAEVEILIRPPKVLTSQRSGQTNRIPADNCALNRHHPGPRVCSARQATKRFLRTDAIRRIKPPAHYLTENLKTVVLSKVSRGRSTTDGKFGLLIESGKCCVSRQKPPKRGYWTPPTPVIEP